jgi:hypothetical protein
MSVANKAQAEAEEEKMFDNTVSLEHAMDRYSLLIAYSLLTVRWTGTVY